MCHCEECDAKPVLCVICKTDVFDQKRLDDNGVCAECNGRTPTRCPDCGGPLDGYGACAVPCGR